MYYKLQLVKDLHLHPRDFGVHMRKRIEHKLISEMEGTCTVKCGLVIAITSIDEVEQGVVRKDSSGMATFKAKYTCIACLPMKGEVMDGVVTIISAMGFFAAAGPLTFFVSHHLMPREYELDTYENCYTCSSELLKMRIGSRVRTRIVGVRIDPTDIFCIAAMDEEYLGVIG